jgi:hypothetical protein
VACLTPDLDEELFPGQVVSGAVIATRGQGEQGAREKK